MSNKISISIPYSLSIIFAAFGYFVYDGMSGAVAIFLFSVLLGISAIVGAVPIAGPVIYYVGSKFFLIPWIFNFTEISGTLLTTVIFWTYMITSIIWTVWIVYIIIK